MLPSIEKVDNDLKEETEKYNQSLEKVMEASTRRFRTLRNELDQAERDWM